MFFTSGPQLTNDTYWVPQLHVMYFLSFFPFLPHAFVVFRYLVFVRLVFYIALNGMGCLTSYPTWVTVGRIRYRKFSFTGELAI